MSEAPEGQVAEEPVVAAEPAAPTGNAATEIEEAAGKGGWLPKDQWTGDPEKWVDAPKFVLRAAEILPQLTADLKDARAEIRTVKKAVADSAKFISAAEKRAYDQGVAAAQARLDTAAASGDVEGVRNATKEIVDLATDAITTAPAQPATTPEFDAWKADNSWFGTDRAMTAAAVAIANEAEAEGYKDKALIKETDARIRAKFPQLYTNPNRDRAAPVEGGGNAPRKTGKSFSDMPQDAREMVSYFEKNTKGFNRDKYIRDYFSETAK